MMHKLITHGRIILIGLSTSLYLSGCIFSIDPPKKHYKQSFENLTSEDIYIVFSYTASPNDTLYIRANSTEIRHEFVYSGSHPINDVANSFEQYGVVIKLFNELKVEKQKWIGPAGSFGDDINSPFNYDS